MCIYDMHAVVDRDIPFNLFYASRYFCFLKALLLSVLLHASES